MPQLKHLPAIIFQKYLLGKFLELANAQSGQIQTNLVSLGATNPGVRALQELQLHSAPASSGAGLFFKVTMEFR